MANHISHANLPYPIRGARYTLLIPYTDADGDPTDPTTPDTEVSKDGAAFADCAEEVTTITGSNGFGYLTLSGAETDCAMLALVAKVTSGPKNKQMILNPRELPSILSGTAQAGAASTITLPAAAIAIDSYYVGCIVKTTGGTGGGGGSGANNQARLITGYVGSTKVATVSEAWETNPDGTTTIDTLLTEFAMPRIAAALATQAKADVNAEVLDVLSVDTFAEPTGVPPQTTTLQKMLGYVYSFGLRNKITITATKKKYHDDFGLAEFEKDVSDDGTTYTETQVNAP